MPNAASSAAPRIDLLVTPLKNGIAEGRDAVIDALIRVQAPDAPDDMPERAPLELSLVLDRSGSMDGEPLAEAKRCAEMIVDHLGPKDRVAIVHFGSDIAVASPIGRVTDRSAVKRAIQAIECNGMTALHGGWLKGAEMIAERANRTAIARVLLLSDGCANEGLVEPHAIAEQAEALRKAGVSTSTYGVGRNFDERLMTLMASAGGGNAYYGKTAQDLMGSFREEFDLLSALCARDVRLRITPAAGVIVEVLNEHPRDGAAWRLPDLAYGGEAWAMLRLRIAAEQVAAFEGAPLADISVSAVDLDGARLAIEPTSFALPVRTAAAWDALEEDALVKSRLEEIEALALQNKAREAAERGDWNAVHCLIADAEQRFESNVFLSRSLSVARSIAETRDAQRLSKEVTYRASRGMRGLAAKSVKVDLSEAMERKLPRFLRRKLEEGVDDDSEAGKRRRRRRDAR